MWYVRRRRLDLERDRVALVDAHRRREALDRGSPVPSTSHSDSGVPGSWFSHATGLLHAACEMAGAIASTSNTAARLRLPAKLCLLGTRECAMRCIHTWNARSGDQLAYRFRRCARSRPSFRWRPVTCAETRRCWCDGPTFVKARCSPWSPAAATWTQLRRLRPAFAGHDVAYVTTDPGHRPRSATHGSMRCATRIGGTSSRCSSARCRSAGYC